MTMKVLRNGRVHAFSLTVEAFQASNERPATVAPAGVDLGLTLDEITATVTRYLRLPRGLDGALVTAVADGGPADDAGVRPGDILREINYRAVHNAMAARKTLADIEGTPVFILVWRQDTELFLQLRPD